MSTSPDPVPRSQPNRYQPYAWPTGKKTFLSPRSQSLELDLARLLEHRETLREFRQALDERALGEFLWLACRSRSSRGSMYGPDQESRVHPSAGAMHPIHVLVARDGGPLERYDPMEHSLIALPATEAGTAAVRAAAAVLLDVGRGIVIGLVAEPGKTDSKYEHSESLVWRDAGVVIGYMSLIAAALGLAFCPLGLTGQPHLTDGLPDSASLRAVGLAVVGVV